MPPDTRIQTLTTEIDHLRKGRHHADDQLHGLILKVTEIQLNLAVQDKTLTKLDHSIHGNGHPGLLTRVDRAERTAATLTKALWLLTTAAITTAAKLLLDHLL